MLTSQTGKQDHTICLDRQTSAKVSQGLPFQGHSSSDSRYNFLVCQGHLEAGTCHLFQTFAEKKKQGVNLKKKMTDSVKY